VTVSGPEGALALTLKLARLKPVVPVTIVMLCIPCAGTGIPAALLAANHGIVFAGSPVNMLFPEVEADPVHKRLGAPLDAIELCIRISRPGNGISAAAVVLHARDRDILQPDRAGVLMMPINVLGE
jgi:hypothetical protein